MLADFYPLIRPLLFSLDAERVHHFTLGGLESLGANAKILAAKCAPSAPRRVMGITFPNPVGLAAGLDKNGAALKGLSALGFGFIEVGTVTPKPQPGNPKPRIFRIQKAHALINRMGFNNAGLDQFLQNVRSAQVNAVLGLNIGKNASTPTADALSDYLLGLRGVYSTASYVAVNISSPNTQGLRSLQEDRTLAELLAALKEEQHKLQIEHGRYVPIAIKIAPDLSEEELASIARNLLANEIDGVIATNTTIARDAVKHLPHGVEPGGLSGAPVRDASTRVIAQLKSDLGEKIPIIGVGGILCGADALDKIKAGAALVQLYTGLIYRGPRLIAECIEAINRAKL